MPADTPLEELPVLDSPGMDHSQSVFPAPTLDTSNSNSHEQHNSFYHDASSRSDDRGSDGESDHSEHEHNEEIIVTNETELKPVPLPRTEAQDFSKATLSASESLPIDSQASITNSTPHPGLHIPVSMEES